MSKDDLAGVISVRDAIDTVTAVFRAHGAGLTALPAKTTLDLRPFGIPAWHNAMPGFVQTSGATGLKWVGGYARNRDRGLPFIMAMVILQDSETGYPLAVLEGSLLTTLRTGAVVAVCAKQFARRDSAIWAFIGAGVQAKAAFRAATELMPMRELRIHAAHTVTAARFADSVRAEVRSVTVHQTARDAVTDADVVVTATTADAPLIQKQWIRAGTTVISIGSFQELDDDAVLGFDKIYVDSWAHCSERGELTRFVKTHRLTQDNITAEIGDVLAGHQPGRQTSEETILVVPMGLPTHDLALAQLACDRLSDAPSVRSFRFL